MNYAIVFSSRTGNTKMLADALKEVLPEETCTYFGVPDDAALSADRLYIGFWTDKGTCDTTTEEFLRKLHKKELFLFGTSGFGEDAAYFETIMNHARQNLDDSNSVTGTYMCQGKMPMAIRARYEKMMEAPDHAPNLPQMIKNFDNALSHPDNTDLENLKKAVLSGI